MRYYAFLLVAAVAACHPSHGWHITMPKEITATPPESTHFAVWSSTGGVKAGRAQMLFAQCKDEQVCEARATPGDVEVIPKNPGSTTIFVSVANAYDRVEHHEVEVTVTAAK